MEKTGRIRGPLPSGEIVLLSVFGALAIFVSIGINTENDTFARIAAVLGISVSAVVAFIILIGYLLHNASGTYLRVYYTRATDTVTWSYFHKPTLLAESDVAMRFAVGGWFKRTTLIVPGIKGGEAVSDDWQLGRLYCHVGRVIWVKRAGIWLPLEPNTAVRVAAQKMQFPSWDDHVASGFMNEQRIDECRAAVTELVNRVTETICLIRDKEWFGRSKRGKELAEALVYALEPFLADHDPRRQVFGLPETHSEAIIQRLSLLGDVVEPDPDARRVVATIRPGSPEQQSLRALVETMETLRLDAYAQDAPSADPASSASS